MRTISRHAGWIFAAAALVRLAALISVPVPPLSGDASDYERLAVGLLHHEGYVSEAGLPTAKRPPLYPAFLAGVFGVFGHRLGAVYVTQGLIDAASCVLIFLVGRRLMGPRAGLIAGLLAIPCLSMIAATRMALSETLFLFLLWLAVWLWLKSLDHPRPWTLVACGATIGLATLTRGIALAFPLVCGLALVAVRTRREAVRQSAILLASCSLVLLPWAVRNWRVFHAVVPVATEAGTVVYSSYLPPEGKLFGRSAEDETVAYAEAALSEPEASRFLVQKTIDHLVKHPQAIPTLVVQKLGFFVVPFDWELFGVGEGIWNATYAFILPFALMGMWLSRRRAGAARWLWLVFGYFVVMAVVLYGSPRFRLPVEPCLLIWAGVGLEWLLRRCADRRLQVVGLAGAYLAVNVGLMGVSQPLKHRMADVARQVGLW